MKAINKAIIAILVGMIFVCAFSVAVYAADECAHTGGWASCTQKAKCELCGEEYGELDPVRHSGDFFYQPTEGDSTKHDVMWGCCKLFLNSENHAPDPENEPTCTKKGSCYYCKAQYLDTLPHNFSEASCTHPKICYNCDTTEGEVLPHTGGEAGCLSLASCAVCGVEYGDILGHTGGEATCTQQAVCERCDEAYGVCLPHTGGVPTCQSQALCQVCGTAYGELGEHTQSKEWTITEDFHYNACENNDCLEVFNDADHEDNDSDGKCDVCEYKYKLSQAEIIWIIVGSSLGTIAIITAVIVTVIVIKKKRAK